MRRWIPLPVITVIAVITAILPCLLNPETDKSTNEAWQQVVSRSRLRLALIGPYLASARTMAGEAPEVTALEQAYGKALSGLPDRLPDSSAKIAAFMEQQSELTDALAHLVASPKLYPQLLRDSRFKSLHTRLDENETMLTSALVHYNNTIHTHNIQNRSLVQEMTGIVFPQRHQQEMTLLTKRERVQVVPPPQMGRRLSTTTAAPAPSLCTVVME